MDEETGHVVGSAAAVPLKTADGECSLKGASNLVDDVDVENPLITVPPLRDLGQQSRSR